MAGFIFIVLQTIHFRGKNLKRESSQTPELRLGIKQAGFFF